jgi:hypothetical protein
MGCQKTPRKKAAPDRRTLTNDDIDEVREILLRALDRAEQCEQSTKPPVASSPTPASAA